MKLSQLTAASVPSPFASDAREISVEHNGVAYLVAMGKDRKGFYYTVRASSPRAGYRYASSLEKVKAIIRGSAS